jgi:hypothetical protein
MEWSSLQVQANLEVDVLDIVESVWLSQLDDEMSEWRRVLLKLWQ